MTDWLAALARLQAAGEPACLVTVAATQGSTPREAGARMVVSLDAADGTIGGGQLEHQALAIAREMLAADAPPRQERFPLGARVGQCCGGVVHLAFELVKPGDDLAGLANACPPPDLEVYLFGAGHVGRALAAALAPLPVALTWIDTRDDAFPAAAPDGVATIVTDTPEAEIAAAPADAVFLMMTHSHALDLELVRVILARGDFRYCGLIGSRAKRARFTRQLLERGLNPATVARLTCPIGLPGIPGKEPAVIAAAVAAQVLSLRRPAAALAEAPISRSALRTR
jgi:xanthine dehydrogenase accessory factor